MNKLNRALRVPFFRALALAFVALVALVSAPAVSTAANAKWTLMVYIAANNNLEPSSIINLMEMAAVGSTDEVNIVVQITRPEDYQGFFGEWGGTRRFLVTKSDGQLSSGDFQISPARFADYVQKIADTAGFTPEQVTKMTRGTPVDREVAALSMSVPISISDTPLTPLQLEALVDLGPNVNSGDGATLAEFGTWAVESFPADHYGLVLWDHGGGWSMIASDDTQDPLGIQMPDLSAALDTITRTAQQKLDFIGFDACLMSQLAVATTIAPFADYQIAAEELVPGIGWDYIAPLAALTANPDISVPDLARTQIDAFYELYTTTEKEAAQAFDMGVLDLSRLDGVLAALDNFGAAVSAAPLDLGAISTARGNAQAFGEIGETADVTISASSIDLAHFMQLFSTLSTDQAVRQAAQNVVSAIDDMVLYHRASKNLPNARGLAVFFPKNAKAFEVSEGPRYAYEFSQALPAWQSFIVNTYGAATASSESSPIALQISAVTTSPDAPGNIHDTPVISYTMDGQNIVELVASITYQIDDQTDVVLDQFPVESSITMEDGTVINDFPDGESLSDFYWSPRLPSLSDGTNELLVLMTSNSNDKQHGFIRGTFTNFATGKSAEASLLINLDTYESGNLWVASKPLANATVAQVTPRPGDTFEPAYLLLDVHGETRLEPSETVLVFANKPLQVTEVPGPDGAYSVTLQATDAAGASVYDTAYVDIANAGLDDSLQGFKDLTFGLSFLYPYDWTDVGVIQRSDGSDELYVTDESGDQYLSAAAYVDVASLSDLVSAMKDDVATFANVTLGDYADEQVGDYPGTSLSYVYKDADDNDVFGFAVAVHVPDTGQGYVLFLEASPDQIDAAQDVLNTVLKYATFFPPAE